MNTIMALLAAAAAAAAVLLPLELVEILGAPLVVAGAYLGGMRGVVVVGLWAMLVATVGDRTARPGMWAFRAPACERPRLRVECRPDKV
jgi:hypothetical protein